MDFADQIRSAIRSMVNEEVFRSNADLHKRILTLELELSVLKGFSAQRPLVPTFYVQLQEASAGAENILQTIKSIREAIPNMGLREAKNIAVLGGKIGPLTRNVANELYYKLTSLKRSCTIEDQ